jgi:hypothetical protein
MLRFTILAILFLTGCEPKQVKNPVVGQVQEIESPLQNTLEGMAKAKDPERDRGKLSNLQLKVNPATRKPLF